MKLSQRVELLVNETHLVNLKQYALLKDQFRGKLLKLIKRLEVDGKPYRPSAFEVSIIEELDR